LKINNHFSTHIIPFKIINSFIPICEIFLRYLNVTWIIYSSQNMKNTIHYKHAHIFSFLKISSLPFLNPERIFDVEACLRLGCKFETLGQNLVKSQTEDPKAAKGRKRPCHRLRGNLGQHCFVH
jgi:hypothetical protein